jgi:ubiquinone/menaquinone biosynthesis C-methylase UbiE
MGFKTGEFDYIARNIFAPVYPLIAEQIKEKIHKQHGLCLDLGCGGGYLGMALAEITGFQFLLLDLSDDMIQIAKDNIIQRNLQHRMDTVQGDVHAIPLDDNTVNLIISRGSIFFWDDLTIAFKEIKRVLKPDGIAYIGGGLGNQKLKDEITKKMAEENFDFSERVKSELMDNKNEKYILHLEQAGCHDFHITRDETGFWITIRNSI